MRDSGGVLADEKRIFGYGGMAPLPPKPADCPSAPEITVTESSTFDDRTAGTVTLARMLEDVTDAVLRRVLEARLAVRVGKRLHMADRFALRSATKIVHRELHARGLTLSETTVMLRLHDAANKLIITSCHEEYGPPLTYEKALEEAQKHPLF